METPQMLTHVTPRDPRVTIIPRFRPEPGDTSDSTTRPPTKVMTREMLLELMMVKRVEESPYKRTGPGPGLPVSIWEVEGDGVVRVRVEMPGAGLVVVYPNPNEKSINFKGVEEEIGMHGIYEEEDKICRVYEGTLYFDSSRFNSTEIIDFDYEFGFGVLYINIKCKGPPRRGDLGVTLKAKLIEARNDITVDAAINTLVSTGRDRYCLHGFKDKAFIFAVDMPGIGEHDKVSLSVKREFVNFYAQDTTTQGSYGESEDEERREYDGYFKVSLLDFDTSQVQYEIVHGVLWIMVPRKVKPLREVVTLLHGVQTEGVFE